MSFTEKLDAESLAYFNEIASRPFAQQAVAFLNAYFFCLSGEAPFIYHVAWKKIQQADMHHKGIQLIYKYDEGKDLDFDMGLYFFEQLCKFCEDPKSKEWQKYTKSQPVMMTAIKRKQELREKVDVNFDGRVSFLEYLLYQYQDVANPADFCKRSMKGGDEHPEIRKARLALEEANKAIKAYEEEKARLEEGAKEPGVKGLKFKNMLAQLGASPLWEAINKALITAEAAVRIAVKKFGGSRGAGGSGGDGTGEDGGSAEGAAWWMNENLQEMKQYQAKNKQ